MHSTPASLLEQLRTPGNAQAWERFVRLYTPLLFYWSRRLGLQESDAADLVQDVFTVLVRQLPSFSYDRRRSFRNWLRTILLNRWREDRRRQTRLPAATANADEVADTNGEADVDEAAFRRYVCVRALDLMQTDFQPATWKACWEHVACGRPAPEVAAELGLTVNAVYLARARVLRRLRKELDGFLD